MCGAQILALEPRGRGRRFACHGFRTLSPTTDSLAALLQCFFRAEPVFLVRPDGAAPFLPKQIRQSGDALLAFLDNRFSARRFDGNVFLFILLWPLFLTLDLPLS